MSTPKLTEVSSAKSFGGLQKVYSHESTELKCKMNFAVFIPPVVLSSDSNVKRPVLYWLSGLTCTEQNFITKSGYQRYAAENNLVVVAPDTSPRGYTPIAGDDDSWDFGTGAGFYVDAVTDGWKDHYRMYSYVTKELISLVESELSYVAPGKRSISGHSMGGHGALITSLKNPSLFTSVSAFAPINNPTAVPWGKKAFTGYLGPDEESWKDWDATCLLGKYNGPDLHLLVDQGTADPFLTVQLDGKNFIEAASKAKVPLVYRLQDGYDHSYYFISTFIEEHIKHHAKLLNELP